MKAKKMSKLVLFTASFPFGKKETYLETEIKYLCAGFDKVEIYPLYYNDKDKTQRSVPNNAVVNYPVIPISKIERIYLFLKGFVCSGFRSKIFFVEFFKYKVYESRNKFRLWLFEFIDFIIVSDNHVLRNAQNSTNSVFYFYWGVGWSYCLSYLKKNNSNSYVVRVHGGEAYLERSSGYIPLRREVFGKSDLILTGSRNLKKYIVDIYGINSSTICISRLGTPYIGKNPYDRKYKDIRMVSVSNMIDLKRINLIIEIIKPIVDLNIEWIHFGDGPLFSKLKNEIKKLPKNVTVIFKGRVLRDEIFQFYKSNAVDFFINVSLYEGVPVSIMEAMSFGIPIIATDAGATSEIVDEKNGLLLPIDFDTKIAEQQLKRIKNNNWTLKRHGSFEKWHYKCSAEKNYSALVKILLGRQNEHAHAYEC